MEERCILCRKTDMFSQTCRPCECWSTTTVHLKCFCQWLADDDSSLLTCHKCRADYSYVCHETEKVARTKAASWTYHSTRLSYVGLFSVGVLIMYIVAALLAPICAGDVDDSPYLSMCCEDVHRQPTTSLCPIDEWFVVMDAPWSVGERVAAGPLQRPSIKVTFQDRNGSNASHLSPQWCWLWVNQTVYDALKGDTWCQASRFSRTSVVGAVLTFLVLLVVAWIRFCIGVMLVYYWKLPDSCRIQHKDVQWIRKGTCIHSLPYCDCTIYPLFMDLHFMYRFSQGPTRMKPYSWNIQLVFTMGSLLCCLPHVFSRSLQRSQRREFLTRYPLRL